jgi:hypothetical protein
MQALIRKDPIISQDFCVLSHSSLVMMDSPFFLTCPAALFMLKQILHQFIGSNKKGCLLRVA